MTIGPVEILVFLAGRKRVSPLVLVLLVIVLSPFGATGLAFFTGVIVGVFAPA